MNIGKTLGRTAGWTFICISLTIAAWCQKLTSLERSRAQSILHDIAADVRKHYYDPKFHGLDWEEKVHETSQKIDRLSLVTKRS